MPDLLFSDDELAFLRQSGVDTGELSSVIGSSDTIDDVRRKLPELFAVVLTSETEPSEPANDVATAIRSKFEAAFQHEECVPQKDQSPVDFLKRGWIERARKEMGLDVVEYADEIRLEFAEQLKRDIVRGKYNRSADILKAFEDSIDFSEEIDGIVSSLLEKGSIKKAKTMLDALGKGLAEYKIQLESSFLDLLQLNNVEGAKRLEREYGDVCDFKSQIPNAVLPEKSKYYDGTYFNLDRAKNIIKSYPEIDFRDSGLRIIEYLVARNDLNRVSEIQQLLRLNDTDEDVQRSIDAAIPHLMSGTNERWSNSYGANPPVQVVKQLRDRFALQQSESEYASQAINVCLSALVGSNLPDEILKKVAKLQEHYRLEEVQLADYTSNLPSYLRSLIEVFSLKTASELYKFTQRNDSYIRFIGRTPNTAIALESADLDCVKILHLNLVESEKLKRENISLHDISDTRNFDQLLNELKAHDDSWEEGSLVTTAFEEGAIIFGRDRMFEFAGRTNLSRHDALHAFRNIINLYQASGLSQQVFFNNILSQVCMDSSRYEEGTAHHHLNAIAQSANFDFENVLSLAEAQKERGVGGLDELIETLQSPQQILSSWRSLKKYNEMTRLLGQTEILEEMRELRSEGKDQLCDFIQRLAFHPASNVNLDAVMQFWRDTIGFLEIDDSDTPERVHDRKKPSNYIHIPHLDLDAEELRDALVEGTLDKLQVFTPMEIRYELPKDINAMPTLRDKAIAVVKSLKASNMKKARRFFGDVDKKLKQHGMDASDYLSEGAAISIPSTVEDEIKQLTLQYEELEKKNKSNRVLIAKLHAKSSPEGILAGNDTACCMPFGSGKNNVYMFNPTTAMFTLQIEKEDGSRRTVAQSLVTKDKDIKKVVSEILYQLEQENVHLSEVIPEDILKKGQKFASADNVEVSPNYDSQDYEQVIELLYRDFFKEYMQRFAVDQNLCPDWMPIGEGYSDALKYLPHKPNTYAPEAPIGYSDKTHDEVLALELDVETPELQKEVVVQEPEKEEDPKEVQTKGVSYLDFTDTLPVAYLEGKAYSDNESLIVNLHNIENALIAKDINNTAKNRPNMSLKYEDETERMRGYMMAYEGRYLEDDQYDEYSENDKGEGEPVIYIADLATDTKSARAGGSLIKAFVDLYKRNYIDKGNMTPLYLQARESTSYRIIQRQLSKMGEGIGVNFELEEMPTYQEGGDTMHPIIIRPLMS